MSSDTEKSVAADIETYRVKTSSTQVDADADADADTVRQADNGPSGGFTPAQQKRIIRRIDLRLVVTIGLMYCASLVDRINLSSASIAGMQEELRLDIGVRYSLISLIFFVPYILLQPLSNVLVREIGPRIQLSSITLFWGAVVIGMGFVKNWNTLVGLRVILGIFEAAFFPSCIYLLSTWYTRYEIGKRTSLFYLVGCVVSAFTNIVAAGIMQMNGVAHMAAWRWIFIIEGILTCLVGIASYWLLVDFPDASHRTWSFLGERERAWVVSRINADRGDVKPQPFLLSRYLQAATDWHIWVHGLLYFCATMVTYALAYFLPIILVGNMGFGVVKAQCLGAPPYITAGLYMFAMGALGDKYRLRGPIVAFNAVICLIGLPIVGYHPNAGVRYFGIYLVTIGASSNMPAVLSLQANNIRGQWKRAMSSALFVAFGGIGGICGSLVFRSQDFPTYRPGIYACIAVSLLSIVLVAVLDLSYYFSNKKANRDGALLESEEGEPHASFRYTY